MASHANVVCARASGVDGGDCGGINRVVFFLIVDRCKSQMASVTALLDPLIYESKYKVSAVTVVGLAVDYPEKSGTTGRQIRGHMPKYGQKEQPAAARTVSPAGERRSARVAAR